MALQMLGSKYCIDSLREDVTDLQESIIDVFSRAGPVRTPSWKYPDKTGSDLDMTELLELYDYSDDEEDRQIAHIVLLELVIDRLILFLQSMGKFIDKNISDVKKSPMPQNNATSIGLVVKKFWNKVVHSQGTLNHTTTENKQLKRKVSDLENSLQKVTSQREELQSVTETLNETLRTQRTPYPLSDLDQVMSRAHSVISISRDECIKSTQTIETAFVPCESCNSVQNNFRQVGKSIVQFCQQHGLPSNLAKYKKEMQHVDWMTANDVTRWAAEQTTDINRLNKLLSDFDQLKEDLRTEKSKMKESHQKLLDRDKEMKLERETQATQRKHYENKIQTIERNKEEAVSSVKSSSNEILKGKQLLAKQLEEFKAQMKNQESVLADLETSKSNLEHELDESLTNNSEVKRLQNDVTHVEKTLTEMTSQQRETQQLLNREKAKSKSMDKHNDSMQGKQTQLLQRLDEIDRENDTLRTDISELEDTKDQLNDKLETAKDEARKQKEKQRDNKVLIKELTRDKSALQDAMVELNADIHKLEATLQEALEHEKLLVEYPDLNGPVNTDINGTGDLAKDMENQVKANSARIRLLEEQNTKLRNTITKVLQSRHQLPPQQQTNEPVPLWRAKTPIAEEDTMSNCGMRSGTFTKKSRSEPRDVRGLEQTKVRESFVVGKAGGGRLNERTSIASRSRPGSANKTAAPQSSANPTSINAYSSLKKADLLQKVSGRPPSGRNEQAHYDNPEMLLFTCDRCDKMYSSSSDLSIHRSYCSA